ncbi:MAG: SMC-Scp complex subunit ScpB [Bacteroidia bacterium]|jgi:segregation and condensation protein B|nr:SMC-Scp complex subunit ScpB [Bacteroidia bacterium]
MNTQEATPQEAYPLENLVEAFLFVNPEPLALKDLHKAVEYVRGETISLAEVEQAIEKLRQRYRSTSIELLEVAGGYALRTKPGYGEALARFWGLQQPLRLSRPLLETLAIIAYHQPTTRPFINHLRGAQSDYAVEKLLELELIEPAGRADLPGKPLLYRTTKKFLELLGLRSLEELPRLSEISQELLPQPTDVEPPQHEPAQMPEVRDTPHHRLPEEKR